MNRQRQLDARAAHDSRIADLLTLIGKPHLDGRTVATALWRLERRANAIHAAYEASRQEPLDSDTLRCERDGVRLAVLRAVEHGRLLGFFISNESPHLLIDRESPIASDLCALGWPTTDTGDFILAASTYEN